MLAIVLVGQYGLAPAMRELKQAAGGALVEGMAESPFRATAWDFQRTFPDK